MDLEQLATFVRVVEAGSLSAAARSLRTSLARVSRQLRALEDDLGATLVARTTRRLAITDEGRAVFAHAARALAEVEAAREAVVAGRLRGTLTVSAPVTLGQHVVVPRLPALLAAHPQLRVELRLEDRLIDLVAEGVDVAVRGGTPLPDSDALIGQPVARFARILVAAPAYLRRRGAPRHPADLARHDCLPQLATTAPATVWHLLSEDRAGEPQSVEVHGRFAATAPQALLDMACAGCGVALLPDWLCAAAVADRRLRVVLPKWRSAPVPVWAMYRAAHRGSAAVRAFVEAIRVSA